MHYRHPCYVSILSQHSAGSLEEGLYFYCPYAGRTMGRDGVMETQRPRSPREAGFIAGLFRGSRPQRKCSWWWCKERWGKTLASSFYRPSNHSQTPHKHQTQLGVKLTWVRHSSRARAGWGMGLWPNTSMMREQVDVHGAYLGLSLTGCHVPACPRRAQSKADVTRQLEDLKGFWSWGKEDTSVTYLDRKLKAR